MMVLEGEVKTFTITLQNASSCPVDFVLFTLTSHVDVSGPFLTSTLPSFEVVELQETGRSVRGFFILSNAKIPHLQDILET
jgi:hypothetical protein